MVYSGVDVMEVDVYHGQSYREFSVSIVRTSGFVDSSNLHSQLYFCAELPLSFANS